MCRRVGQSLYLFYKHAQTIGAPLCRFAQPFAYHAPRHGQSPDAQHKQYKCCRDDYEVGQREVVACLSKVMQCQGQGANLRCQGY